MNDNEIEDALDALKRLERDARAYSLGPGVSAEASRAAVRVDADVVRECIGELRREARK